MLEAGKWGRALVAPPGDGRGMGQPNKKKLFTEIILDVTNTFSSGIRKKRCSAWARRSLGPPYIGIHPTWLPDHCGRCCIRSAWASDGGPVIISCCCTCWTNDSSAWRTGSSTATQNAEAANRTHTFVIARPLCQLTTFE